MLQVQNRDEPHYCSNTVKITNDCDALIYIYKHIELLVRTLREVFSSCIGFWEWPKTTEGSLGYILDKMSLHHMAHAPVCLTAWSWGARGNPREAGRACKGHARSEYGFRTRGRGSARLPRVPPLHAFTISTVKCNKKNASHGLWRF